ncbi:MAG TPA: DUF72 domain-containing protein [Beijerinckiaceae bacterium]|nr:DUF72 domain-containing protein [Beijerinckiaceae bacterium]
MIRVGVGGWTYEPWRGTFYPPKLPQAQELSYASRQLTSIEINGTFYRTQTPASYRKWAGETPDGFVFALKGSRYVTNRAQLAEAGPSITRFLESGLTELGDKLGPILWQFAPTKKFDGQDFGAFLDLLPKQMDGRAIRHVVEVRHMSFAVPEFITLLRRHDVPVVYADADEFPAIPDVTGDFVYARLQRSAEDEETGYAPDALAQWARRFKAWSDGGEPDDLPRIGPPVAANGVKPRDCFVYFIAGAKVRAPAAAKAFIERIGTAAPPS